MVLLTIHDTFSRNLENFVRRVKSTFEALDLKPGASLSQQPWAKVIESGLVVEFVLRPLSYHRDVRESLAQTPA